MVVLVVAHRRRLSALVMGGVVADTHGLLPPVRVWLRVRGMYGRTGAHLVKER